MSALDTTEHTLWWVLVAQARPPLFFYTLQEPSGASPVVNEVRGPGICYAQGMDLSSIQFKEVNQKDLTYVDPAAKEAANNVRSALGPEYAGAHWVMEC